MPSWKERWNPKYVRVTNKCERYKRGYEHMFDGVLFTFPYNTPVDIPEIAANHIFAYAAYQVWKKACESGDEQLKAKVFPMWEKERNHVLARNMWNMKLEKQLDGSVDFRPDPQGPATLSSFELAPVPSAEAA